MNKFLIKYIKIILKFLKDLKIKNKMGLSADFQYSYKEFLKYLSSNCNIIKSYNFYDYEYSKFFTFKDELFKDEFYTQKINLDFTKSSISNFDRGFLRIGYNKLTFYGYLR